MPASRLNPPTTDEQAHLLAQWAVRQPDRAPTATFEQISGHLDYMLVTLSTRRSDEQDGEKRATVYAAILSEYSNEALSFMAMEACKTLDWFPTPRQCLDILKRWREPVPAKVHARNLCQKYWQTRFDEFAEALSRDDVDPAIIENVNPAWLLIAEERGLLRRLDDGQYVIRSRWHGPRRLYIINQQPKGKAA